MVLALEYVPLAASGDDDISADLLTESLDVYLNHITVVFIVKVVDVFGQPRFGEHLLGMRHQVAQKTKLNARQYMLAAICSVYNLTGLVETNATYTQEGLCAPIRAPHNRL